MKPLRRIYPKSGRVVFDGGKNSKYERSIILDNESPDCLNVTFSNGSVGTREGISKLNTTPIGSFPIEGLYTRRSDTGAETMIAWAGGSAWQLGVTTFSTIASAQSVFSQGYRVAATQYENHIFFGNGRATPYKYNGTDFTRHGVSPPTTTATVASNGAGNLSASGDYRYKVTFVNSQLVESDVGPVTSTFTVSASSGQLRLTSIPVAPQSYGVASRYIYRTSANGSSFKRVGSISDNTTTTFDDNVADSSLGVAAPSDNGVPPNYSVIAYHQNRLFMNDPSNPNYVWYTNLGDPYTVAQASNFIKVGDASSDIVESISVYQDGILIGCERSFWMVYMPDTDPTNWKTVRITSPYGTKSPFSLIDYNNKKLFAAVENDVFVGFAAISGTSVSTNSSLLTVQSMGSDRVTDRIESDMFLVQKAYLDNISSIVYKNKAYITLTYGNNRTQNNRIYQMDFSISNLSKRQSEAWVPWTGISASQFTIYNGLLYAGTSLSTGYVYQLESGEYNDDGQAIDSYFWTKEFTGYAEDINFQKDFRFANLLIDKPASYYMDVTVRVDSDSAEGDTYQVSLNPGGSLWGSMVWGVDEWGGGFAQQNYTLQLGTTRGKRIQFKFSNQNAVDQRFKVHYMNFTYNVKGQR